MDILQIVGLCLVATVIIIVLKSYRPEIAIQISIVTGIVVFFLVVAKLTAVIDLLKELTSRANIDMSYVNILLKIIGIAYIAEFGAEVCRDAGETSIASKIELAAKVIIVVLAVPIMTSLLELIIRIMP
ncbi:MAG TPA: stage III sporulation protein AD [Clostridiaceae bacterium]|nr:stage III sporulation protein AD [Clostridiaceae bacterium]